MITYNEMREYVVLTATIEDGYYGDCVRVGVALFEGEIYHVTKTGYYHAPRILSAYSELELIELAKAHPNYYWDITILESTPC